MNNNLLSDGGEPFMAARKHCPFCNELVEQDEEICPYCGEENRTPKTIEELLEYCKKRGMPLHRMRFFIGENYKEPKAFGIYEEDGRYIVYKNKANGTRAVRYHGPDEAYAVRELFLKLLDECHNRGIYPDGKPGNVPTTRSAPAGRAKEKLTEKEKAERRRNNRSFLMDFGKYLLFLAGIVAAVFLVLWILTTWVFTGHKQDGYYRSNNTVYYKYGDDWYCNYDTGSWYKSDFPEETIEDYYLGKDYDSSWGDSDFKESSTWSKIEETHSSGTSSSDYDSWDYNDTNWDSDW